MITIRPATVAAGHHSLLQRNSFKGVGGLQNQLPQMQNIVHPLPQADPADARWRTLK